jgi:hypothetical protein
MKKRRPAGTGRHEGQRKNFIVIIAKSVGTVKSGGKRMYEAYEK